MTSKIDYKVRSSSLKSHFDKGNSREISTLQSQLIVARYIATINCRLCCNLYIRPPRARL